VIWRHSANARWGVRSLLASDGRGEGHSQNCAPYMGSGRGWLAGNWPSTAGVLNITAAAWTAGFQWWCSGDITRTQNVSEYMLILAVCLVVLLNVFYGQFSAHISATIHCLHWCNTSMASPRQSCYTGVVHYKNDVCISDESLRIKAAN